MIRFLNAVARAIIVLVAIALPSFMLPDASQAGQDIALVIGGIVAVFTLVEYASTHPGFVDFRFAPPYNRIRFASFVLVLVALVLVARASAGLDANAAQILSYADRAVVLTDFPFSPVPLAVGVVSTEVDGELTLMVGRAAAVSVFIAGSAAIFFTAYVWLLRWPTDREQFNLWTNLPTFDATMQKDVGWRLKRSGFFNVLVAVALPFALLTILSRSGGWFDPSALENYHSLVWGCIAWTILPLALFFRGMAMLKLAWLIDKART